MIRSIRFLMTTILNSFVNPVVIISLFGPMMQNVNMIFLKYQVSLDTSNSLSKLRAVLDESWARALLDYNTQMFVLFLAWVFIFVEFGKVIHHLRKHSFEKLKSVVNNSLATNIMLLTVLILFFAGIALFMIGVFGSPSLVYLYLPSRKAILGNLSFPPLRSSITIARGVIILQGIYFSYWKQKVLPPVEQGLIQNNGK